MTIDEELTLLDSNLRRLKIEYEIYFSNPTKRPPSDIEWKVLSLLRKFSDGTRMSFSQRFRFSTLVTRYYVYKDRWRREVQSRELGLEGRSKPVPKSVASAAPSQSPAEAIRISISDPKAEEEKVRQLYDVLIHLKRKETQETPLPYAQFAKYIANQTLGLQKKYGCARVTFTIALDEDALRFTATTDDL